MMAQRRSFGHFYLGTIVRPRRTFDTLMTDERRLRFGLTALASNALYTLVYDFLTMRPRRSSPGLPSLPSTTTATIGSGWRPA